MNGLRRDLLRILRFAKMSQSLLPLKTRQKTCYCSNHIPSSPPLGILGKGNYIKQNKNNKKIHCSKWIKASLSSNRDWCFQSVWFMNFVCFVLYTSKQKNCSGTIPWGGKNVCRMSSILRLSGCISQQNYVKILVDFHWILTEIVWCNYSYLLKCARSAQHYLH